MAKTRAEVDGRDVVIPDAENPIMHLQVRRKGDGKISTGEHDAKNGDVLYETGESFSVRRDVALPLIELDYVDEIPAPTTAETKPRRAAAA